MRKISILGSTGSIGRSTLSLLDERYVLGQDYEIEALVGGGNYTLLAEQALKYRPKITVLADETKALPFKAMLNESGLDIGFGETAVIEAASRPCDWIMAAIVGIAGMKPVWAAAGTGAIIALANKESLVCTGRALIERIRQAGGILLPVDSEHNAIFQVFDVAQRATVSKLVLTASGGPFFGKNKRQLMDVTREQALIHPNWSMGAKITIDSASLANKGLELIEAAYLFDMPSSQIEVLVHPESVVHSMVVYQDGSFLAQLGAADMRIPISFALAWPNRLVWRAPVLDLTQIGQLNFSAPDLDVFPMLSLARQALESGDQMPIVFNAANEACVAAFLEGKIAFWEIAKYVELAMKRAQLTSNPSLSVKNDAMESILDIDRETRMALEFEAVV